MNIAHLHPMLVHFSLGWGLLWVVRDLIRSTGKNGPETDTPFMGEGTLIAGILGIATGWMALAWDDTREFRGWLFWPGAVHEGLALSAITLLGIRVLGTKRVPVSGKQWLHLGVGGMLLIIFLLTGLTGEWLVFGWGATGRDSGFH